MSNSNLCHIYTNTKTKINLLTTLGQNFQPGASNNPLNLNYWMTIVAMAKKFVNLLQSLSDNITWNYMIFNILGVLLEEFRRNQRLNIIKILEDFGFYSKN